MEQEDYIKRQIDQLGRVLAKILADLTGLKNQGQTGVGYEAADQALINELGLNIDDMTSIPTEKFIKTLQDRRKLSNDNLDNLAEILFLIAEELNHKDTDNGKMKKFYERSLIIYEHLDKTSSTYSFDRHNKIEQIKETL
ncbi:MAG: hypothetical protein WCS03_19090 [Bacteroidota bacterium]